MNKIDTSVHSAIKMYFIHGLSPGSFTRNLILGDTANALAYAHPMIMNNVTSYVRYVDVLLPPVCRNNSWPGYTHCNKEQREQVNMWLFNLILSDKIAGAMLKRWINNET